MQGDCTITYQYDAEHRRIATQQGDAREDYFYQGPAELGSMRTGHVHSLRVPGYVAQQAAVALELDGIPYIPLYDLFGNVATLLDMQGRLVESYRYSAFGERQIWAPNGAARQTSAVGNPWQYAGKRYDEATQLVLFGQRYYDPRLGRWITPDPAGLIDGANLYAYVHNNPLRYYDPQGLYSSMFALDIDCSIGGAVYDAVAAGISVFRDGLHDFFGAQAPAGKQVYAADEHAERSLLEGSVGENTRTYNLNSDFSNAATGAPFNLKSSPHHGIGFTNGIQTDKSAFDSHMQYLAKFSDHNIHGVHWPSNGIGADAKAYFKALFSARVRDPVHELQRLWYAFFKQAPTEALYLHIAHSCGVVHTRNALLTFPEELRQRIMVLAIAPGCYIDDHLCKQVKHVVSTGDPVPHMDMAGYHRCKNSIILLDPAEGAKRWFDHDFQSPTYAPIIRRTIEKHNAR